jgi:regulatory protein
MRGKRDPKATPILHYAVKLLAARPYSERKLSEKLAARGYEAREIAEALARLREKDLISDPRFARDFVRARVAAQPRGRTALIQDLVGRGIAASLANEVVRELVEDDTEETFARELIARKSVQYASLEPEVRKRRLAGLLARRGFRPQMIYRLLDAADDSAS